MSFLKTGLLATTIVAFMAPAAIAADIDTAPQPAPAPFVQQDDNYVSGWYVRGDAGFSWLDISGLGDGGAAVAGGGVGYQINQYFRTDLRADHAFDHDAGPFDVSATTVLWNAYVDVPLSMGFTPYVGIGAGYGFVDYSGAGSPSDDEGFAWTATAGVAFQMSQNITLDAGYNYREIDVSGPNYADHVVTGGLRWSF
ncbi:outer membrane beta-barrel protein [Anderseniella sp. Alg231-50]|uniref:outer membrane beta-barrel protein n=1 Tax=Anderseniella sp. Alg231-50 TaxID=1922226 RepID=UPI000D55A255